MTSLGRRFSVVASLPESSRAKVSRRRSRGFEPRRLLGKALFLSIALSFVSLMGSIGNTQAASYAGRRCSNNGDPLFCMACNIYFEGRGEPYDGKVQVGRTVLTRLETGDYAHSVCNIIYSPYQFSWTIRGSRRLPRRGEDLTALDASIRAARAAMSAGPNGATHFKATYVNPRWSHICRAVPLRVATNASSRSWQRATIGRHTFFNCSAQIDSIMGQVADASGLSTPLPYAISGEDPYAPRVEPGSSAGDEENVINAD